MRIMLAALLTASAACALMGSPLIAHATSVTRQDLRTVSSGGIVLDLDLCDRIPALPAGCDCKDSVMFNPQLNRNTVIRDIRYRIDIPGDSQWHTFSKTIDLRFNDCGFDADGSRIDMVYRINGGWRYSSNTATPYMSLLGLWPGNPYDSSGITYGGSPWFTPDWSGAHDYIKTWAENKRSTVHFYKKGTSTPATGKLFQFFSDVEGDGGTNVATGEHVFVYNYPSSWNLYLSSASRTAFHSTSGTVHASGVGQSDASLYEKGFGCYLRSGSQFSCYGGIDILNQLDPVRVTTSAGAHGKITSGGYAGSTIVVGYMGSRTLQIAPDTGYHIASVKADGASKGTPSTYTFSNMTANHALAAAFAPNAYKVAFKPNGAANTMADQAMTYDAAANLKDNALKRTGYTFAGWNTKADGTGTGYANRQSVKSLTSTNGATVTLYAQWRANAYAIAFDANGGAGSMEDQAMTYDEAAELAANRFSDSALTWQRWNTRPDGSGSTFADGQSVSNLTAQDGATVTLYAQWAENPTITFEDGWGNVLKEETVAAGSPAAPPEEPEKPGYSFTGWDGPYDAVTDDATVYAEWQRNRYAISFDSNGGEGSMDDLQMEFDRAKRLPRCAFQKTGYRFAGWVAGEGDAERAFEDEETVTNLSEDADATVVLHARWLPRDYIISFDANGATGTMDDLHASPDEGADLPPCGFTFPGKGFRGWALQEDGAVAYPDAAPADGLLAGEEDRITLFAVWEEDAPVLITYRADDPARASVTRNADEVAPLSGKAMGSKAIAEKGYAFDAWVDAKGEVASTTATMLPARNSEGLYEAGSFTAVSHPVAYAIRYDGNGGSGSMPRTRCAYGEPATVADNGFAFEGKRFAGWGADLSGRGRTFDEGESVLDLASEEGAEVTLYALWEDAPAQPAVDAPEDAGGTIGGASPEPQPEEDGDANADAGREEGGSLPQQPEQILLSDGLTDPPDALIGTGYAEGGSDGGALSAAGTAYDKTGDELGWVEAAFAILSAGAAAGICIGLHARRKNGARDEDG